MPLNLYLSSSKLQRKLHALQRMMKDGFVVDTSEGPRKVDTFTYECILNKSMLLPCRHIFALHEKFGEPCFTMCFAMDTVLLQI